MNYNYANYQTPPSASYPNNSGSPAYGNGNGHGNGDYPQTGQQSAYSASAAQRQPVDAAQYGVYPSVYGNHYQPPPSPASQVYNHPTVVIPQRNLPAYSQSPHPHPYTHANSQAHPQTQAYPPTNYHAQTPLQQPQWQGQQQQQRQQQSLQSPPCPHFPAHAPPAETYGVKTFTMVEIPQRRSSEQAALSSSARKGIPQEAKGQVSRPLEPPVDYQLLLLSLAEVYINAAHGMGPMVALYRRTEDMEQYYQLVATGLACMESVLQKFRLPAPQEAWLILQYASLMFTETESYSHVEAVLSKGIALCDRNKLLDLKYSMQHLFSRVLFKTKPRAALKSLDSLLPHVEAYQHIPWIYAFRFLRVSLSLQLADSHHELLTALHHLRAVSNLAESQGDSAVYVTCTTLEAMVHMRTASADSIEQVQRAIASARSLQLQDSVKDLVQVWTLLDFIDLSCSLMQCNPEQVAIKNQAMQELMDNLQDSSAWSDDGTIAVPLSRPGGHLTDSTNGIFQRSEDGKHDCILFSWLTKRDLYTLGILLSGIAIQLKSTTDRRAENVLNEGVKLITENFSQAGLKELSITPQSSSLSTAALRLQWWTYTQWYLHLHLAFVQCNRSDWSAARIHLKALLEVSEDPSTDTSYRRRRWTTYLTGIIEQGSGNTAIALSAFQDPLLAITSTTPNSVSDSQGDLRLLAALNTLLIIRSPAHPQHYLAEPLMTTLAPLTLQHTHKSIVSATYLLKSILNPADPITEKKQSLQSALNNARAINNSQLLAVSMNVMTSMFFKDIVSEQAQKSTKASQVLAKRAETPLWGAVASGMMVDCLEKQGHGQAADRVRVEADRYVDTLPECVKKSLLQE